MKDFDNSLIALLFVIHMPSESFIRKKFADHSYFAQFLTDKKIKNSENVFVVDHSGDEEMVFELT